MGKRTALRGSVGGQGQKSIAGLKVKKKQVIDDQTQANAEANDAAQSNELAASKGAAHAPALGDGAAFAAMLGDAAKSGDDSTGSGPGGGTAAASSGGGVSTGLLVAGGLAILGGAAAAAGGGKSSSKTPTAPVNQPPVITSPAQAGVTNEDGTLSVTGKVTASDPDAGATATFSGSRAGTYGSFTIDAATGTWKYDLNNSAAAVQALAAGETKTETFTVTVTDDKGATATQNVVITVNGANDAPVITSSAQAGAVAEDGAASATGTVASSDVDNGKTATYAGSRVGTYGSFTVDAATGAWKYDLNNSSAAVQALAAGETKTETFTVTVTDDKGATATQSVVITVNGTNDGPVVTNAAAATQGAVAEAGNLDDGTVVAGTASATGSLTSSDVDAGATKTWSVVGTSDATYGSFAVNAETGVWTYTLNNDLAATKALKEGESKTLTYTVRVTDDKGAYVDQTVTVVVNGTNDVPKVTNAAAATQGSVTEAGNLDDGTVVAGTASATGSLTSSDDDADATKTWSVVGTSDATYGSFAVNAETGVWTYTLNNDLAATKALKEGESKTLTYTVRVTDDKGAYVDQTVTVVVNGTNDVPKVTNAAAATQGSVTEAGNLDDGTVVAGTASATGSLTSSDDDADATKTWSVVGTSDATYGSFAVNAETGVWTYTLNNDLAATKALKEGESKTLTYTVRVTDDKGAYVDQTVTVVVNGTNDVPKVTNAAAATQGSVTEAGNLDDGTVVAGTASATGSLTSSDDDADATKTWSVVGTSDATYGSFAVNAGTGVWTYTLNNDLAATKALKEGESKTLTYTVRVTDDKGAYVDQTVTVVVNGTNDVPKVTNAAAATQGSVTEAGNLDDGTVVAGTASATGSLTSSDDDADATKTWSVVGTSDATYGSFAVNAETGVWTYTLNNDLAATKALKEGESKTLTYTVRVTDDKGAYVDQTVTVVVNGTNDVPVIADQPAVTGNEDSAGIPFTVSATDSDAGDTVTFSAPLLSQKGGSISGGQNGQFTYVPLPNFNGTDSVVVTVTDSYGAKSTKLITFTVASNINEVQSIDVEGETFDANGAGFTLGDNFKFTDNSTLPTNVVIRNFTVGDTIEVTGASSDYSFTTIGDDVIINGPTEGGIDAQIVLLGAAASISGFIFDEETAEDALGWDFFTALTNPGSGGSGAAGQGGNLDIDNDQDLLTTAVVDAGAGNISFTEDANVANNVAVTGFGVGDLITVSNAASDTYSFTSEGTDLLISSNKNGVNSAIKLVNAISAGEIVFDLATANAAIGFEFFKLQSSTLPTQSLAIDNGPDLTTLDAAGAGYTFLDDATKETNVKISNFTADDLIKVIGGSIQSYSFTTGEDPNDLVIVNDVDGSFIVLDNAITDPLEFVFDYESAVKAVGFNFMQFG